MNPEIKSVKQARSDTETFSSVLFPHSGTAGAEPTAELKVALDDLQLNQIFAAVTAGYEEYDLESFFRRPLKSAEEITYRHRVFIDLQDVGVRTVINALAQNFQELRKHLEQAEKLHYLYQRKAVFAIAVKRYCAAIDEFRQDIDRTKLASPALHAFKNYVVSYADSEAFHLLKSQTGTALQRLNNLQYCVGIKGSRVTVSRFENEANHEAEVQETFKRFQQGSHSVLEDKHQMYLEMDHVEATILENVAKLFPEAFEALDQLFNEHQGFADPTIMKFDREIQFYLAYLDHTKTATENGLHFCFPTVSDSKNEQVDNAFDLALAQTLVAKHLPVVTNDYTLHTPERIIIVSGPNQGGKTTFARMVGQLHYLASLGLPVPGTHAELFLPDNILTHFERGENTHDLRGKLMDDLIRVHNIIERSTPASLVILNEIFTSTTLADAINLGGKILGQITEMGQICVCVTFVDELASLNQATVSMTSTVEAENSVKRTFKILRKPADGLAYAMVLAQKYRLTHQQLKERIIS